VDDFTSSYGSERSMSVYAFKNKETNIPVIAAWFSDQIPDSFFNTVMVDFSFRDIIFERPVLIDLITGKIYRIPGRSIEIRDKMLIISFPVYDSPVIITDYRNIEDMKLL
jgi:hypothetical protein